MKQLRSFSSHDRLSECIVVDEFQRFADVNERDSEKRHSSEQVAAFQLDIELRHELPFDKLIFVIFVTECLSLNTTTLHANLSSRKVTYVFISLRELKYISYN